MASHLVWSAGWYAFIYIRRVTNEKRCFNVGEDVLLLYNSFCVTLATSAVKEPTLPKVFSAFIKPHTLDMAIADAKVLSSFDILYSHEAQSSAYLLFQNVRQTVCYVLISTLVHIIGQFPSLQHNNDGGRNRKTHGD